MTLSTPPAFVSELQISAHFLPVALASALVVAIIELLDFFVASYVLHLRYEAPVVRLVRGVPRSAAGRQNKVGLTARL